MYAPLIATFEVSIPQAEMDAIAKSSLAVVDRVNDQGVTYGRINVRDISVEFLRALPAFAAALGHIATDADFGQANGYFFAIVFAYTETTNIVTFQSTKPEYRDVLNELYPPLAEGEHHRTGF